MTNGESLAAASSKPALGGVRTWPNEDPLSDACIRLTKCSDKAARTLAWNQLPTPNEQAQLTAAVWRAALNDRAALVVSARRVCDICLRLGEVGRKGS